MNTTITSRKDGKNINSDGHEIIACKNNCGLNTTMTGTKLCDSCWEEDRRPKVDRKK